MPDDQKKPPSWNKFKKLSFSKRSLTRRVKKLEKSSVRHARKFVSSRLDRLALVKRAVFGWVALVLILIGISSLQWVMFRQAYSVDAASPGGTYSEGVLGPLETLNPIFARSSAEKSAARLLFASLYNYDDSGTLKADLAESVTIDENQKKYTVKMKEGLKWSDGAPLTAQDVVFTVELLGNSATQASISGWSSFKAEATDSKTVVFTLPAAYSPFLHTLNFPILPSHVLAGVKPAELREQSFSSSPITSGPFALRLLQTTASDGSRKVAHLVANPRYIHGQPKLERFQLNVYATKDDIATALKTNEIIATPELFMNSLPSATQKMYQSKSYAIDDGVYAMFNNRDGVLSDKTVRKALALSVDTGKLRNEINTPAAPLLGPVLEHHVDGELPSLESNLDEAKKLLDESGWKLSEGDVRAKEGQKLAIKIVALEGSNFSETVDGLAKIWRENLNVQVDIEMMDPLDPSRSVLQAVLQPRNFDVLVYELVLGGDPDVYAYWHSSQANADGLNFANYNSAISDEALNSARAKVDKKYRSDRYRSFARRWLDDTPALALYQPKIDYISSKTGSSIEADAVLVFPEDRFANVIYWSVNSAPVYKTP